MKDAEAKAREIIAAHSEYIDCSFGHDKGLRQAITSALIQARDAGLEEAAKVAERHHVGGLTAMNIANKIRSLKSGAGEEGK